MLERPRHYEAYKVWRDMGPGRSFRRTARLVNAMPKSICKWAKEYDWEGRLLRHEGIIEKKKEEGALVKTGDPVIEKMMTLLEQAETLIDSVFIKDDSGRLSTLLRVNNIEDLVKLIAEYRRILESYYKFVAQYKPPSEDEKRMTKIDKFTVYMGDTSQEERIKIMESLKNGNVQGRNNDIKGRVQEADYSEVPERRDED